MTTKVHQATPSFAWRITASAASLLLARHSVTGFSPSTTEPKVPFFPSTKLSPATVGRDSRLFSVAVDATGSLPKTTSSTAASSDSSFSSSAPLPYDWKKQWYALTYSHFVLPPTRTAEAVPASVFDHPLVLWRDANDTLYCADDVCPHRASALSEGRIRDGNLECLYHGWQFNGASGGKCVSIPQLAAGASIPKAACLSLKTVREVEGIVWVYMDSDTPSFPPPKSAEDMDKPEVKKQYFFNNFQIDLPYDHSYLLENLLDPAHIQISHDQTEGGGKRENAQAFEMELFSMDSAGFRGRYRNTRTKQASTKSKDLFGNTNAWFTTIFEAPGIIRLSLNRTSVQIGSALHCMPLGLGRSRLLFRTYFTGLPKFAMFVLRLKPTWARHLNGCKVLEQDLGLIVSQEDHFSRKAAENRELKDDFILLKSSDLFVGAYRKWLDRVGHGMPWYQGLASSSSSKSASTNHELAPGLHRAGHRAGSVVETRYHRHVVHCPETRNALKNVVKAKRVSLGGLVASLTLLAGLLSFNVDAGAGIMQKCLVPAVPIFAGAAALLHKLEQRFYFSFSRRDQLRGEKGA